MPDLFQLKWPIPLPPLDLEEGYTGIYTSLIPVKPAKIQLETVPVGEWHQIGSYNLYVNVEPGYISMLGSLPASKTGSVEGSVSEKLVPEETEDYKELYEDLLKEYNALKEKYDTLEDENSALRSEVSDLKRTINELREKVTTFETSYNPTTSTLAGCRIIKRG